MMTLRECIFCRHAFEPAAGIVECPGCGTELPDESYARSKSGSDDEQQVTRVSFQPNGGKSGSGWPALDDPNIATLADGSGDGGVNAQRTQPDMNMAELMDTPTDSLDATSPSLQAFDDESADPVTAVSAFDDSTDSLSMDLDALAAAVPEQAGVGWRCPKCKSVWSATAKPGHCPACDE